MWKIGMFDMTREDKVNQFRSAAGKGPNPYVFDPMILDVIDEELDEFSHAIDNFHTAQVMGTEEDKIEARAQLCKEWADLQYVVSQAAVYYNIPADPSFNRVHDSNMTKVIDGKVIFREDGKILKPDTYRAPDMRGL